VRIEGAALKGPTGSDVAIADDTTWAFEVAAAAPSDLSRLTVRADGTGHYCTPQAAIDAAGSGNATIEIGPGVFHGIVLFRDKTKLTVRGAGRKETQLAGTNNESMNGGTAKRALIGVDESSEITFERLAIHNRTAQGGSQAEALRMQRCDRCIVREADIISLQDTLLWSGRVYARDCFIAGNVDFIWGTGTAFFEDCEIKTLGRKGYTVQARNSAGTYGYVFVDSRMTSDPGISGHWLGRIDASVYPASHVAYIDCELGSHIDPAGWQVTGVGGGSLRFWEYGSKTPGATPVDVSQRHARSRQLTSAEADAMRDPATVLGGWVPE
jgi:pectinesterase